MQNFYFKRALFCLGHAEPTYVKDLAEEETAYAYDRKLKDQSIIVKAAEEDSRPHSDYQVGSTAGTGQKLG